MLKIRGVVKGVKTEVFGPTDNQFEKKFVGIEVPKPNGFDGEMIVEKVQISRDQANAGLMAKYENIKGQEIEADVFVNVFTKRNNEAGYQLFLSGDGLPRAIGK